MNVFWLWDLFWYGRLCPRCREERTGKWTRWVTKTPPSERVCATCQAVREINWRKSQ